MISHDLPWSLTRFGDGDVRGLTGYIQPKRRLFYRPFTQRCARILMRQKYGFIRGRLWRVWRENRQAVEDALPELKTENFRSPKDAADGAETG